MMLNRKAGLIIFFQALIIVTLFWMLVFYGKDEYEDYQSEHEEEIETPNRVSTQDGVSSVILSQATQNNSGIQTSKLHPATYLGEIKTFGQVVAIDGLIDAKTKYLNLASALTLAKSGSAKNVAQYQRLKTLNADDKNVSDFAVQEALAAVNADKANIQAADTQLKNLLSSIQLQWGDEFSKLVAGQSNTTYLTDLLTRKNVLIQVSLPLHTEVPKPKSQIHITPLTGDSNPILATYISPASQSDASGFGKTFFYSAPADYLRTGMRVNVETDPTTSDDANGVVIPNSAVVWHAGQPWVYIKQGRDQFIRKPISTSMEIDAGWFNQHFKTNTEVVTSGAQLLLSEEFKFLIKNENDD
jgi:hypothetical protein